MIIIQDILVSEDVVEQQFLCNLTACKGACCWEGDFGAPLEPEEMEALTSIFDRIRPYLTPEGLAILDQKGLFQYNADIGSFGTPLLANEACAYMTKDKNGVAQCGIEQAYNDGVTDFKKPISCHLYPLRVLKDPHTDFEAINYDKWDICSAACTLGKKHQLPVYQFVKPAIIRKYGEAFYEELDAAAQHLKERNKR